MFVIDDVSLEDRRGVTQTLIVFSSCRCWLLLFVVYDCNRRNSYDARGPPSNMLFLGVTMHWHVMPVLQRLGRPRAVCPTVTEYRMRRLLITNQCLPECNAGQLRRCAASVAADHYWQLVSSNWVWRCYYTLPSVAWLVLNHWHYWSAISRQCTYVYVCVYV